MREIEIKASVDNKKGLLDAFQKANIHLSPALTQRDQVFGPPGAQGGETDVTWLRLRTQTEGENKRYIFTLKKALTGQLDNIEHETEVRDPDETIHIMRQLGFTAFSDLTKTRRKGKISDDVEICVDSIEGLGDFVEVEKLTDDDADPAATTEELWNVLARFAITRSAEVAEGYDILMRKKQGLEG